MTWEGLNPPYRTIVADPPWEIPQRMGKGGRRAWYTAIGYSVMVPDAIADLPVYELRTDDRCTLFLWITPKLNREGLGMAVASAWGFRVSGEFVWEKPNFGAGAFPRAGHEILLVCTYGSSPLSDAPRDVHSVQRWPQVYATNGGKTHSAKPAASFDLIERVSPGPYVELFGRQPRLGWDSWGWGYESAPGRLSDTGEAE